VLFAITRFSVSKCCSVHQRGLQRNRNTHSTTGISMVCDIILHLINLSNERPLFVPRGRPILSRIGSKKVRIFSYDKVEVHFTIVFQR